MSRVYEPQPLPAHTHAALLTWSPLPLFYSLPAPLTGNPSIPQKCLLWGRQLSPLNQGLCVLLRGQELRLC